MNLISKKKSLLKSDEIARIIGAVEELAGDSVAHDGAAIVKNDGAVVSILAASDPPRKLQADEKVIVINKYAPKIEYLAGAKTERRNSNFVGIETTPLSSESGEPISCKIILEFSPLLKQKAIYAKAHRLMNGADRLVYKDFAADIGATLKPVVAQTVQSFLDDNGGPEKFVGADAHTGLRAFAETRLEAHLTELGLQFKDLQCELQNEAIWRGKSDKLKRLSAELQDAQTQMESLEREASETKERYEQASELEKQRYAQVLERDMQKQRQLIQEIRDQRNAFMRHLESREVGNASAPAGHPADIRSELDEKRAKKLFERAKTHLQMDNDDHALDDLNEAIVADPESIESYKLLGLIKTRKDDHDGAIVAYEKLLKLDPKNTTALLDLANCKYLKDDYDGAIVASEKLLKLDPENTRSLLCLGACKGRKGDYDGAIVALEKLLELDPKNTIALGYLVAYKLPNDDDDGAIVALEKLLKLDPENTSVLSSLVKYKILEDDDDGAIVALEKLLKIAPENTSVLSGLSVCKQSKGDYDGAIVALEKLLKLDPKNTTVLLDLAECKYRKGDDKGALDAYKKLLELDPQNEHALSGIARINKQ